MGNFRCWTFDKGTKTKLISYKLFGMMEEHVSMSISAQLHCGGIEYLELWLPFLSWAVVSEFHLLLMLLQIITVWVFFNQFTSF